MCLRAIGKVAGSRERLARDSRSAHKRDEQESKLEKRKKLEWDPERRRHGERGATVERGPGLAKLRASLSN